MTASAAARSRVAVIERLMDAHVEVGDARRADEREDAEVGRSRRYVRAILASLRAAGEADAEHDQHLGRAQALLEEALGALDGVHQQILFPAIALSGADARGTAVEKAPSIAPGPVHARRMVEASQEGRASQSVGPNGSGTIPGTPSSGLARTTERSA